MIPLFIALAAFLLVSFYLLRFHLLSTLTYFSVRLERRIPDLQLLHSLRQSLVHEKKKKMAVLELTLATRQKGESIQPEHDHFRENLQQLKELLLSERRNLMSVSSDMLLWAKLWRILIRVEKVYGEKIERSEITRSKAELSKFRELLDEVVEQATEKLSFSLNDTVWESIKTVRIEKSESSSIKIEESLDDVGDTIRFSYARFQDWQRFLTNLIRNAFEAVEAKQSGTGPVAANLGLPGGAEIDWVKITTKPTEMGSGQVGKSDSPGDSVSVIIEDSGIGMDEHTKSSFFKKGYTSRKEHGLGLGVTEECVEMIGKYGGWEIESKKGVGTKITINIDQDKTRKSELILPKEKPFYRTKLAFGIYFFALVLVGLTLLFIFDKYSRFWVDWNPNSAQVQDQRVLIAFNEECNELWRRKFDREIQVGKEFDSKQGMEVFKQSVHIEDVNSDGKNEVLIGFLESESKAGFLMCLDYKGIELWSFLVGATEVYERGNQIYAPSREVFVADIDQDGEKEVVLSSNCKTWFPCQLLVLSKEGRKEGEYWHSGHIAIQFIKDMDRDGKQEIVCGGVNNQMGACPVVFVLDGMNVHGQSPPYTSNHLPKAKEEIYVKIPRLWDTSTKVGSYPSGGIYYNGTEEDYEQYVITVDDYERMRREYIVDQDMLLKRDVIFSHSFYDEWTRLKQANLIDFDVTPDVIEEWMKFERWEKGEKVR